MATPVFKFQHPDLPGEDLYFIHNTFFELPETIPMDLTTFIWYHQQINRTLEGFFAAWDNLNQFQTSLEGHSFEEHFNENEKQQLYDDALFGLSLNEAKHNQKESLKLKEFIDSEKYKTDDIFEYVNPNIKLDYISGNIKLSFFYSRHYFMQYLWDNFNDKLDESDSYKHDKSIILALNKINGLGLSFASENLKKDSEVLLQGIKNDFRAFYFVDNSLKENKPFIIEALKKNVSIFQILENRIQNDEDICLEKTKQECLIFFEKEIRDLLYKNYELFENSNEVHEEDCSQETINYYNILSNEIDCGLMYLEEYAKDGPFFCTYESFFPYELLKNDEDYILNLFEIWPHTLVDYNVFYSVASSRLLKSKNFIIELLKLQSSIDSLRKSVKWNWTDFPISYWSDDEFVKAAIKVNGNALQYANDSYKKDKELVIQALKSSKSAIQFVDESLKNDEDVLALLSIKPIEIKDSEEDEDLPF
ncbi:DUF4116 domain-containing protein [Flavobacterium aciduliphilum]|uniref:Uncharacterized protein DUF4116 n=1 Tax=Flavobacterium aciduliphilum TaxID=1101402 RepID=A0A328YLW4_9FLAO|nr:DUF4116 domain-containing protein [Flavobacterium aciduliphilum]RAR73825.1 uncharacterized protein DUF4116 [Flavobacterium aciduliphilum]